MVYCSKCGTKASDSAQFCQSCGTSIGAAVGAQQNQQPVADVIASEHEFTHSTEEERNGMAIIAYILFFIPLLTGDCKKSEFVKYHTNQGALLFIATIALAISTQVILAILSALLLNMFAWGLIGIITTLINLLWIVPTILLIIGIMNAANNKTKPLPIIGERFTIIK
jgi:uncharacterized membrane protein